VFVPEVELVVHLNVGLALVWRNLGDPGGDVFFRNRLGSLNFLTTRSADRFTTTTTIRSRKHEDSVEGYPRRADKPGVPGHRAFQDTEKVGLHSTTLSQSASFAISIFPRFRKDETPIIRDADADKRGQASNTDSRRFQD
jgi:hypothetical protein